MAFPCAWSLLVTCSLSVNAFRNVERRSKSSADSSARRAPLESSHRQHLFANYSDLPAIDGQHVTASSLARLTFVEAARARVARRRAAERAKAEDVSPVPPAVAALAASPVAAAAQCERDSNGLLLGCNVHSACGCHLWRERCYPRKVLISSAGSLDSAAGGANLTAGGTELSDIGRCGMSLPIMVLVSVMGFLLLFSSVFVARACLLAASPEGFTTRAVVEQAREKAELLLPAGPTVAPGEETEHLDYPAEGACRSAMPCHFLEPRRLEDEGKGF